MTGAAPIAGAPDSLCLYYRGFIFVQIVYSMYCPDKLKLNRFKAVSLPKNRDYMTRLGYHEMPSSQFTGDDPVDFENRKTEVISAAQRRLYDEQQEYEQNKSKDKE